MSQWWPPYVEETPPAAVAADPRRLALWVDDHAKKKEAYETGASHYVVRGCGERRAYRCYAHAATHPYNAVCYRHNDVDLDAAERSAVLVR